MTAHFKKALLTKVAALGIVMLGLGSATTWAADQCFAINAGTFGFTLVGKNFSMPAPGTCRGFDGVVGGGCTETGTACGTSDTTLVRFNLTSSCTGFNANYGRLGTTAFYIDRVNADLPLAGTGYTCFTKFDNPATWGCAEFHVQRVPCTSPVPVD